MGDCFEEKEGHFWVSAQKQNHQKKKRKKKKKGTFLFEKCYLIHHDSTD